MILVMLAIGRLIVRRASPQNATVPVDQRALRHRHVRQGRQVEMTLGRRGPVDDVD